MFIFIYMDTRGLCHVLRPYNVKLINISMNCCNLCMFTNVNYTMKLQMCCQKHEKVKYTTCLLSVLIEENKISMIIFSNPCGFRPSSQVGKMNKVVYLIIVEITVTGVCSPQSTVTVSYLRKEYYDCKFVETFYSYICV